MCVCVLEILVLKNFKLRDYFERLLCWLDHWLSCMLDCIHVCVFLLSKNCFEKRAQHLLDTLLSVELLKFFFLSQSRQLLDTWWIDRESSCLLDSSLTPGGLIELLFLDLIPFCSILAWYLSCRWPFSRHLPRQLPQHLLIPHLLSITEGSI